MSSKRRPRRPLIADTIHSLRRVAMIWVLAGTAAMYVMTIAIKSEMDRFPGGAKALAASVEAGAVALRWMRWPAERLDTIGGYITYHNVTLFVYVLALYAVVKGVSAVRGAESRGEVEMLLATGVTRRSVVRDRALGFGAILGVISLGIGLGLALSMAATDESNVAGSLLTGVAAGCAAFMAYAIGSVVAQLMGTARSASGTAALVVTVLYIVTNEWQQLGAIGALRFVSPFYYFTYSRALVPGHGFSLVASSITIAMAVALIEVAGWTFERRDVRSALWARRARPPAPLTRVQRPALRSLWSATLVRERVSLVIWSASSALGLGVLAWLEPNVVDVWNRTAFIKNLLGNDPQLGASAQYLSFSVEIIIPIVAAFVITRASSWVGDLREGRVEIILATPLSADGLLGQRLMTLATETLIVIAGSIAGLAVGAATVHLRLGAAGLVRVALSSLLFAVALGAVALVAVAWLRSDGAVTALSIFISASYVLALLVQLFNWPEWITRATIFGAIGHPYLQLPPLGGIAFLAGLGVAGVAFAAVITRHSSRIA